MDAIDMNQNLTASEAMSCELLFHFYQQILLKAAESEMAANRYSFTSDLEQA